MVSDKCKGVAAVMLVTSVILVCCVAVYLFFFSYLELSTFELKGGNYIPTLDLNFQDFSFYIFVSICMCIALLVVALGAAQLKKPYSAFAYWLLSVGSGSIILMTSNLALSQNYEAGDVCSSDSSSMNPAFN